MAWWYYITARTHHVEELPVDLIPDVAELAAIGTWRYSQGLYQLDQQLQEALVNSTISGKLPSEVFYRLPEWSLYVLTPGLTWLGQPLCGFWAHLEADSGSNRTELRFLLDREDGLMPFMIHLGAWTLTEAVERSFAAAMKHTKVLGITPPPGLFEEAKLLESSVSPLVSILLYLCSEEPEIDNNRLPGTFPHRSKPVKTKQGWRLFPPKSPTLWSVGTRIGEQLRAALKSEPGEATGRTVKTHLRRGHHHGFWTGPKKTPGERKLINRWISPLIVRGRDEEDEQS